MSPVAQPLNIAQHYNMDFIGPLPRSSNGNHCLMITVDRFSRRVFLYAISKYATSEEIANLTVDEMFMRTRRISLAPNVEIEELCWALPKKT